MGPGLATCKCLQPWDERNDAASSLILVEQSAVIKRIVVIKLDEKTSSVLKWSNFFFKFVDVTASLLLSMRAIGAHSGDDAIFPMDSL